MRDVVVIDGLLISKQLTEARQISSCTANEDN